MKLSAVRKVHVDVRWVRLVGLAGAAFSSINHLLEWDTPLSCSSGSAACIKIKPLKACVPKSYWTYLRQWSQQLRTLMIWTHWGLLLRAYRLAARSPINSFLLKLFARQHKSILFWLGTGGGRGGGCPCEICQNIFIEFFQMNAENEWLICMRKKTEGQWFGFIGISISASIFIRDAFVMILFSLLSTGLNYISCYPWY